MDLLPTFDLCKWAFRTSRDLFICHVGIGSHKRKLDYPFSVCLIPVSVSGSNASILDTQDSSTNTNPCDKVLEENPFSIFKIM